DVDPLTGIPPEQFDVRPVKERRPASRGLGGRDILWRGREHRRPRWSRGRDGLWRGGRRPRFRRCRGRGRMGNRASWILKTPRDECFKVRDVRKRQFAYALELLDIRGERGESGHLPKHGRARQIDEIFRAKEHTLAVIVLGPQPWRLRDRAQPQVDDNRRKTIDGGIVIVCIPPRVLIIRVSNFVGPQAREFREKDAVVVNEHQFPIADQDVAVLQITVRDLEVLKPLDQGTELGDELLDAPGIPDVLSDKGVQGFTLDPLHLDDRIPVRRNPNALREVKRPDKALFVIPRKEVIDGRVPLLEIGDDAREAPDGPLPGLLGQMERRRKAAGVGFWDAELIALRHAVSQLSVAESGTRVLNRSDVFVASGKQHGLVVLMPKLRGDRTKIMP